MTRLPAELELTDGVVMLRRWSLGDVDDLAVIWQDEELQRRFGVAPPVTTDSTQAYVDGVSARWGDGLQLSLTITVGTRLVGGCDLDHLDAAEPDLGYWIAAASRGNGYATRAARLLLDWADSHLGVGAVHVEVEPDNAASIAVAECLGFTRVPDVERFDGGRRMLVYERRAISR